LKNGKEVKGIVVEEYDDRLVMSTYEGEKTFFKKQIQKIKYDLQEQNFEKLGDKYMSQGRFERAYYYYNKALKVNPDYKRASDKIAYIRSLPYRSFRQGRENEIARVRFMEKQTKKKTEEEQTLEEKLKSVTGLSIAEENGRIEVVEVKKKSPGSMAGIRKNDILAAVWGRFTDYMPEYDVARLLLKGGPGEIRLTIERDIVLKKGQKRPGKYSDIINATLKMLPNGLTVLSVKPDGVGWKIGLKKHDLVIAINGSGTRYMPFDEVVQIIEKRENDIIEFTIRRAATIWRTK